MNRYGPNHSFPSCLFKELTCRSTTPIRKCLPPDGVTRFPRSSILSIRGRATRRKSHRAAALARGLPRPLLGDLLRPCLGPWIVRGRARRRRRLGCSLRFRLVHARSFLLLLGLLRRQTDELPWPHRIGITVSSSFSIPVTLHLTDPPTFRRPKRPSQAPTTPASQPQTPSNLLSTSTATPTSALF